MYRYVKNFCFRAYSGLGSDLSGSFGPLLVILSQFQFYIFEITRLRWLSMDCEDTYGTRLTENSYINAKAIGIGRTPSESKRISISRTEVAELWFTMAQNARSMPVLEKKFLSNFKNEWVTSLKQWIPQSFLCCELNFSKRELSYDWDRILKLFQLKKVWIQNVASVYRSGTIWYEFLLKYWNEISTHPGSFTCGGRGEFDTGSRTSRRMKNPFNGSFCSISSAVTHNLFSNWCLGTVCHFTCSYSWILSSLWLIFCLYSIKSNYHS